MQKILPILFKFLEFSPIILAAVLPLLFVPLTTEYFETAKVSFFYIFTALVFVLWSIKMASEKKVSFVRSRLDLPLILLAVAYGSITLLSPNKYIAVFGSYLRFQPSLLFTLAIIVLYYSLSANLRNREIRRLTVVAFVLSVGFSCALALGNFFGAFEMLNLGTALAFLKNRAFNTTGSLNILSVLAGVAFTLGLGLLGEGKINKTNSSNSPRFAGEAGWSNWTNLSNYLLVGALFTTLAIVVMYSTLPGWGALVVGLIFMALFEPTIFLKQKMILIPLGVWAGLLFLLVSTPVLSKSFNVGRPAEINLSLSDSWVVASQSLTNSPLVGAGLGQFSRLFNLFRPLAFNDKPYWNLRFDRPGNEFLLLLSETGLLGLGLTLFLLAKISGLAFTSKSKESYLTGVRAALITLSVIYLLTVNSVLLGVALILLLSVFIASEEEGDAKLSERVAVMVSAIRDRLLNLTRKIPDLTDKDPGSRSATQILPYFLLLTSILAAIFVGMTVFFGYGAEYYNRLSLAAVAKNDGREAYNNEVLAIAYNPNLDVYQRNLAQLSLGIAANISSRAQVGDGEKQTIADLIQESVRRARIVTEIIEPASVTNWETRAQIYQNLIGVGQGAEQLAVEAYAQAIRRDPINPNLRILLGSIYFGLKNYSLAADSFAQAISLKSDLANGHYNLAQALILLNRKAEGLAQYDVVLNLIGPSSPDYEQALKEREALAKQVQTEATVPTTNPLSPLNTEQDKLTVPPPTTNLEKKNVSPLNLSNPKEASPASRP